MCFEWDCGVGPGTLPPEYAGLTSLEVLDVSDNYLTGRLPDAYFSTFAFNTKTALHVRITLSNPPEEHVFVHEYCSSPFCMQLECIPTQHTSKHNTTSCNK